MKKLASLGLILICLPFAAQTIDWAKIIPGPVLSSNKCLASDQEGNLYLLLNYRQLAKFNADGVLQKKYSFSKKIECNQIAIWNERLYFCGSLWGDTIFADIQISHKGQGDAILGALDLEFKELSAETYGGLEYDSGDQLAFDSDGNLYFAASFRGSVNFKGNNLKFYTSTQNGYRSALLAKFSKTGSLDWFVADEAITDNTASDIRGLYINRDDELLISGYCTSLSGFALSGPSFTLSIDSTLNNHPTYNCSFGIKTDKNSNVLWSDYQGYNYCDRCNSYGGYIGQTSKNSFYESWYYGINGGYSSTLKIKDEYANTVTHKDFGGNFGSATNFQILGVINDEACFFFREYKDYTNYRFNLVTYREGKFVELAGLAGEVYQAAVTRNLKNRQVYFAATLTGSLSADGVDLCQTSTPQIVLIRFNDLFPTGLSTHLTGREESITVYPTVSTGLINISHADFIETNFGNVFIYNALGNMVLNTKLLSDGSKDAAVDISSLTPGVYYLRVQGSNSTTKIVRQ